MWKPKILTIARRLQSHVKALWTHPDIINRALVASSYLWFMPLELSLELAYWPDYSSSNYIQPSLVGNRSTRHAAQNYRTLFSPPLHALTGIQQFAPYPLWLASGAIDLIFSNTACTVVRPTTAWSTTRLSSSIAATQPSLAATQPSPAHPTLECSTDGKKLKVISNVHPTSPKLRLACMWYRFCPCRLS